MNSNFSQDFFRANSTPEDFWGTCLQYRRDYLAWRAGTYKGDVKELEERGDLILLRGGGILLEGEDRELYLHCRRIFRAYDGTFKHSEMLIKLKGLSESLLTGRQS